MKTNILVLIVLFILGFNLCSPVFSADDWLGIGSTELDSSSDGASQSLKDALDGTDTWYVGVNEIHWFVLDLGQTYTIKKVRGRSLQLGYDPTDVNIYIDDDNPPTTLVHSGITTWQDTSDWVEIDITDSDGRYIKVEVEDTEHASDWISWGSSGGMTIFDAYGEIYVPPDTTPPAPSPLTWSIEPASSSSSSISMTGTTATDDTTPISYQFDETTGGSGATDRGWIANDVTHTDDGLAENTKYGYKCQARDAVAIPNVGDWSTPISYEYTYANVPTSVEFSIDAWGTTWINMSVLDVDNNPIADSTGTQFELVTDGGGGTNSGWIQSTASGRYYYNDTGLTESQTYGYKVRYRNGDGDMTAYTSEEQQATSSEDNIVPTLTGEVPANASTSIDLIPELYVLCTDNNDENMNATWWSNSSGSWLQFASNWTSFTNNTNITQSFTNASVHSTTYWWSVNLTDGTDWTNETYHFTTNTIPTLSGESPTNGSIGVSLTPALYVICTDADSDVMTATWRSNSSGAWMDFAINTSISTGTNITQTNSNFSVHSTTYWWSVNLTDGTDWTNETYHFMVEELSVIIGYFTYEQQGSILELTPYLSKWVGDYKWKIEDEEHLVAETVWIDGEDNSTHTFTSLHGGEYIAYLIFRGEDGLNQSSYSRLIIMTGSYPAPPPPLPPEEIPDEIKDVDMFKDSRRVVSDWIAERKIEEGIFIFACLVAAFLLIIFLKPIKKRYFKIEKREKP